METIHEDETMERIPGEETKTGEPELIVSDGEEEALKITRPGPGESFVFDQARDTEPEVRAIDLTDLSVHPTQCGSMSYENLVDA
jgi:hypothetical protein